MNRYASRIVMTMSLLTAFLWPAVQWEPPLGDRLEVTAAFDLPNGPYQVGHRGIDLAASVGSPIRAPTDATVAFVGVVAEKPVITLRIDEATLVSFEPAEGTLLLGEQVSRRQQIGTVAVGGHCRSECLHLGVRVHGEYVNPLRYFWGRAVLLPW